MAKIKYTDLAEDGAIEQLRKEFELLKNSLKAVDDIAKMLKIDISEISKAVNNSNINTLKGQQDIEKGYRETKTSVEALNLLEKEKIKLEKELIKNQTQLAVEIEKSRLALNEQKKVNREAAKEESGLIGSYQKKARLLNELRNRYKDLAVSGKGAEKGTTELRKSIEKLDKELKDVDAQVGQNQRSVGDYGKALSNFGNLLKTGLGFVGITAGFEMLKKGFMDFVTVTQTSGDLFRENMSGMSFAYDTFLRNINTGNWDNFFGNLSKAYKEGKKYEQLMDEMTERNYALSIAEAEKNLEYSKLEKKLRNARLSEEERIEIGNELLKLENDYLEKNLAVKQKAYEAAIFQVKSKMGMTEHEFKLFAESYNDMDGIREQSKNYQNALIIQQTKNLQNFTQEQIDASEKYLKIFYNQDKATQTHIKQYTHLLNTYGKGTDEIVEPAIKAWVDYINAQTESENKTKRAEVYTNNMIASKEKETKATKDQTKALEDYNDELDNTKYLLSRTDQDIQISIEKKKELDEKNKTWTENFLASLLATADETSKKLDDEEEKEKERIENRKEMAQKSVEVIDEIYKKSNEKRITLIDKEIEANEKRVSFLSSLAEKQTETSTANLAYEIQKQAELERKRENELKRQQRIELAMTAFKTYSANADKDPKSALTNTIKDITLLRAFISVLPSALDGAIDTGDGGDLDKDGGMLWKIHKKELIMPEKPATEIRNTLGNNFAFDDIATAVKEKKIRDREIMISERFQSNKQIIQKLDDLQQSIENKPAYMGRDYDATNKAIVETIISKYKVERNIQKLKI